MSQAGTTPNSMMQPAGSVGIELKLQTERDRASAFKCLCKFTCFPPRLRPGCFLPSAPGLCKRSLHGLSHCCGARCSRWTKSGEVYGDRKRNQGFFRAFRQSSHSTLVVFRHPADGERVILNS